MTNEYPMYTPHKLGKLYKGFIFTDKSDIERQLTNFVNYKTFRWVLETVTEKGDYQTFPGLMSKNGISNIRTNSLEDIHIGDIVHIEHPVLGAGYYTVSKAPTVEGIYCPKYRQTYQHLEITPLDADKINREDNI